MADLAGDLGELPLVVPFGLASGKEPFASETASLAQIEERLSKVVGVDASVIIGIIPRGIAGICPVPPRVE